MALVEYTDDKTRSSSNRDEQKYERTKIWTPENPATNPTFVYNF